MEPYALRVQELARPSCRNRLAVRVLLMRWRCSLRFTPWSQNDVRMWREWRNRCIRFYPRYNRQRRCGTRTSPHGRDATLHLILVAHMPRQRWKICT